MDTILDFFFVRIGHETTYTRAKNIWWGWFLARNQVIIKISTQPCYPRTFDYFFLKKNWGCPNGTRNLEWNLNSSSIEDAKIIRSFYFNEENEQFCKDCPISMINWWGLALMLTNFDIDICKDRGNTIAWGPRKKKQGFYFFSSNFCPLLRLIWVLFISDNLFMGDKKIIFSPT